MELKPGDSKFCIHCGESIRRQAVKCRHCKKIVPLQASKEELAASSSPENISSNTGNKSENTGALDPSSVVVDSRTKKCPKCSLDLSRFSTRCSCGWRERSMIWPACAGILVLLFSLAYFFGDFYYQCFPDNEKADEHFRKGNDLYYDRQPRLAVEEYKQAVKLAPLRSDVRYRYGWALSKAEKPYEAAEQMKKAVELSPNDLDLQKNYGSFLEQCEEYEKAAAHFMELSKKFPKDMYCLSKAGENYERAGKMEKALEVYIIYLKQEPDSEFAWTRAANTRENPKEAAALYREGLERVPKSSYMHYQLGLLLAQEQKTALAAIELRKAADLDPDSAPHIAEVISDLGAVSISSYMVPLQQTENSFFAEAILNNKSRVKLLVDSGAESCVINSNVASKLGIKLNKTDRVRITSVTGEDTAHYGVISSLCVGRAERKNVEVLVYDVELKDGADGILGMNFLNNFVFSIDAKHRMLDLRPKASKPQTVKKGKKRT